MRCLPPFFRTATAVIKKGGRRKSLCDFREGGLVMPRKSIKTNKTIKSRATELRVNMTDEERKLWYSFLSDMTPKFQRQKAFGYYIVDFYCAKYKLALKLMAHSILMKRQLSMIYKERNI